MANRQSTAITSLHAQSGTRQLIEGLTVPAILLVDNKRISANAAYMELFTEEQTTVILSRQRLHHAIAESLLINRAIAIDIKDGSSTFHCTVTPVVGNKNETIIFFEDISSEAQGERNNALLYRISLILSVSDRPLQERLQLTVDQLLLELSIFDCTIFLLNEVDGYIRPIAWGTTDLNSKSVSRGELRVGEGISGRVAQQISPIVVPDISKDKRILRPRESDQALGLLSVPLSTNGRISGVLSATRVKTEPFSDRDLQLFTTIANRLASLVENFRKDEEEDRQNEIVRLISDNQDVKQQYPKILSTISQLLQVDTAHLLEINWTACTITSLAHATASQKVVKNIVTKIDKRAKVNLLRGIPIQLDGDNKNRSPLLLFPVTVQGECDHLLYVQNTCWNRTFTEHEITMGTTAATQLASAMQSAAFHTEALTERKKLQQIQSALQDGLILYTPDLRIDSYNNAARRILGIKKDVTGLTWQEVMQDNMEQYCKYRLLRQFDPQEAFAVAMSQRRGVTSLGTVTSTPPKTLEISIVPVFDANNQLSGILSHFRDITPMYELQTKMAVRVKQLTNLFKISSVTGFDVQNIVRKILTLVLRLLSVRVCQLMLVNAEDDKLYIVESLGDQSMIEQIDAKLAKRIEKVSKNLQSMSTTLRRPDGTAVEVLVTPVLGHHNACIGALLVADKETGGLFTREDTKLLSIVAARIAMKIDNARLVKQVESDREKMAAIIEQSGDGILVIDEERRVQLWNTALERITGIAVEDVRGRLTDDIELTLGSPQNISPDEGATELQIENRKTGKKVWIGATYASIMNAGEASGYVAIIRDISRRKELEQAKNEFVSTASHELRSPITAIVGYLSMLKRGDVGPIADTNQAKFIDKAYTNAKRMVDLIEDLLTTTRMETGQLRYQYESVDPLKAIEGIVSDLQFRAEEKNITIVTKPENAAPIYVDRDAIHQVITNVVTNAIKYTPQHGNVVISFQDDRKNADALILAVKDDGVGIDPEDQDKVFDKFTRVDNPLSVNAGGTGLGLYITKMIVEQLGGKIWVKSKKNAGSTFYIRLPRANTKTERK